MNAFLREEIEDLLAKDVRISTPPTMNAFILESPKGFLNVLTIGVLR
jgi:hypothetical protein